MTTGYGGGGWPDSFGGHNGGYDGNTGYWGGAGGSNGCYNNYEVEEGHVDQSWVLGVGGHGERGRGWSGYEEFGGA